MLLTKTPGYTEPTLAIFPFPWYDNAGRWMMKALKLQPDDSVKWGYHFIDSGNGHAKAEVYEEYQRARAAACEFNIGIDRRIATVRQIPEVRKSLLLKAEKEITAQQRLADEERLMMVESMRRCRLLPPPRREELVLPQLFEDLLDELYQQLVQAPKLSIVQFPLRRISLIRTGASNWSRVAPITKETGKYYYRDRIGCGFGLTGGAHWGRTKAAIRSMLLPRANELLQLSGVKRLLADALAEGRRVVVVGEFVFWYEGTTIGWIVKGVGGDSGSTKGQTIWNEGTIISKNHGRIVVLPYAKENGEKVQGHTKNAAHDGKALPRHPDEYLELPFKVLNGDLMIGLFGELNHD